VSVRKRLIFISLTYLCVTGFLGSYLIRDLLRSTPYHIYCIVRGKDSSSASSRLISTLKSYHLYTPEIEEQFLRRVRVLIGDLGAPKLGMSKFMLIYQLSYNYVPTSIGIGDEVWEVMAGLIDVIYHNGANVHFIKPYQALRCVERIYLYLRLNSYV
jgi:thioester reductase-like protein